MNVTLLTATLIVGDKSTPLTKAICDQILMAEPEFMDNTHFEKGGDCEVLGEVALDRGRNERTDYWILVSTPRGIRKMDTHVKAALNCILHRDHGTRIERIILLK